MFDPYSHIPHAVACFRKTSSGIHSYDAEIMLDKVNYLIATGFKTRIEALNAANNIITPLLTEFHKNCEKTIKQFKKAKS